MNYVTTMHESRIESKESKSKKICQWIESKKIGCQAQPYTKDKIAFYFYSVCFEQLWSYGDKEKAQNGKEISCSFHLVPQEFSVAKAP